MRPNGPNKPTQGIFTEGLAVDDRLEVVVIALAARVLKHLALPRLGVVPVPLDVLRTVADSQRLGTNCL